MKELLEASSLSTFWLAILNVFESDASFILLGVFYLLGEYNGDFKTTSNRCSSRIIQKTDISLIPVNPRVVVTWQLATRR